MSNIKQLDEARKQKDPQGHNDWGGLPDPKNHKCAEYENTDDEKGIVFCGVCGTTLRKADDNE